MTQVFLGLGGNIGNPKNSFLKALEKISEFPKTMLVKVSSLYKTKPISSIPQEDFLNIVCELRTELSLFSLFQRLQKVELILGKIPKPKNAPRTIDIDLLFYGNRRVETKLITVPHPFWKRRLFVLIPLLELTSEITIWEQSQDKIITMPLLPLLNTFTEEEHKEIILLEKQWSLETVS